MVVQKNCKKSAVKHFKEAPILHNFVNLSTIFCPIFCSFKLKNLVNEPTCYKNPDNPSCIDLFLRNCKRSLHNKSVFDTGISDFHKLVLTIFLVGNYIFKVNNRNTRERCEICSKLTIKTPERRQKLLALFRSGRREVLCKKGVLKNFEKIHWKTPVSESCF